MADKRFLYVFIPCAKYLHILLFEMLPFLSLPLDITYQYETPFNM